MKELRGRVAVVTGGGSGVGEGLSRRLAAEGMRVVVADIEARQAERVAEWIRAQGGDAIAVQTDVADLASVEALADRSYAEFGATHLLCNNAGVLVNRPMAEMSIQDWQWVLSVNLYGPIHGITAFVPRMLRQGGEAHIVNTASMAGVVPLHGSPLGAYTTSKYGLVGLSELLRSELAPHGIGVSVFCPISMRTNIGTAERNRPASLGGTPELVRAALARRDSAQVARSASDPSRPSQRFATAPVMTPEQVAHVIVAGIRDNRAYIFSHPEIAAAIEARTREMLEDARQQQAIADEARNI